MPRALLLPAILLLALALRLCGATWGLPDATHLYPYHPDEYVTALTATRMVTTGDLNPRIFNYGTLGFYLPALWLWPAWHLGPPMDPRSLCLWLRLLPILLSVLTVWIVARIGARLGGPLAGALAGLAYAVAPASVMIARFATVDTQATCFMALALLFALRHLQDGHTRDLVLCAVATGITAATKYPIGLVLLAGLMAAGLRGNLVRGGVLALVTALLTFLLCVPHIVFDRPSFRAGFSIEVGKQGQEQGTLFDDTGNGLWYLLGTNLPFLAGVPLLLLTLPGTWTALRTRRNETLTLLAFAAPCAAALALATMRFLRYALPLLPAMAVFAGVAAARARTRPQRLACALALLATLLLSAAQSVLMAGPEAHDQAAALCRTSAGAGARIGLVHEPEFCTPPVTLHNGGAYSRDAFLAEQQANGGRIVVTGWSVEELQRQAPELFLLSEFERREEERLGKPQALRFLAELEARYERLATFCSWPPAWRAVFAPGFVPHDWLYPFADVRVYRRRA